MYIDELTQCTQFVFQLSPADSFSKELPLSGFLPFLEDSGDRIVVNELLYYQAPCLHSVLCVDGEFFLFVNVFAARMPRKDLEQGKLDALIPYQAYLSGPIKMPYLPALLVNGLKCGPPSPEHFCGQQKILADIGHIRDIYVIWGQHGTGKTTLINKIIRQLFRILPEHQLTSPVDINMVKNHILASNEAYDETIELLEGFEREISHFVFHKQDVLDLLQKTQALVQTKVNRKLSDELSRFIDHLLARQDRMDTKLDNLMKSIYSLPRNMIMYEDDGMEIIKEVLVRLEKAKDKLNLQDYMQQLKELSFVKIKDDNWFIKLSQLRMDMLSGLYPKAEICLTEKDRTEILDLLHRIIQDMTQQISVKQAKKNELILSFAKELNRYENEASQYLAFLEPDNPVLCGGVLLGEIDFMADEQSLLPLMGKADKIVICGSKMEGLFKLLFQAAQKQQCKDGIPRTAILDTNYVNHPAIAKFISKHFYEDAGYPPIYTEQTGNKEEASFVWFDRKQKTGLQKHINKMLEKGYSVGFIISQEQIQSRQLWFDRTGIIKDKIFIGTVSECRHVQFDLVVLLDDMPLFSNTNELCFSLSRAKKQVVAVGSDDLLRNSGIFQDFYQLSLEESV